MAQLRRLLLMSTSEAWRAEDEDEAERGLSSRASEGLHACMRKARRLGEAELTAARLSD